MARKKNGSLPPTGRALTSVFSFQLLLPALVLFVGLGAGIWKVFLAPTDAAKGLTALNAAYSAGRPVESRISALSYAQFSLKRSSATSINEAERRRAEVILFDARVKQPSPEVIHAVGQVYLTEGNFDGAIQEFEEASKADPTNANLLSDLGAAWLEKAKNDLHNDKPDDPNAGKGPEALGKALGYLNKALAQDSNLSAGIFNRALCFEYLVLRGRAEQEWQHYLENDSTSPWAEEARDKLKLLAEQREKAYQTNGQVFEDFLTAYDARDDEKAWRLVSVTRDDLSGTNISQQLLDKHLELSLSGRAAEAERLLRALSYVGELEVKRGNEYYNRDLAALCRSLKPHQKAMLVKARGLMKTGFKMYKELASTKDILAVFKQAEKTFQEAGDTVEVNHARLWIAYSLLDDLDTKRSLDQLIQLVERCNELRHRWLLMKATYFISSAKYNFKEYSKSLTYSLNALALAEEVGDRIGEFDALDTLTEVFRAINNYPQSLNAISRSQRLLGCCAFNSIKVWRHYSIVAVGFYSAGLYDAAIEFQQEALRRALVSGDISMICLSYAHLGLMYGKLGNQAEALKNAKLGYETAVTRGGERDGRAMLAYSSLQLGHLYREANDCENALKNYDEAISIYNSLEFSPHVYQAHKGRLVCYIKQKNDSLAGKELQATLDIIDSHRSTIFEDDNRNKFFDVEQNIYDLATDYVFERDKDGREAFNYSEASRARSLLDRLRGTNIDTSNLPRDRKEVFNSLTLSDVQKRLPAANQILEYTVLEDKTLIWLIDKRDPQVKVSRIGRVELEDRVRKYLQAVSDPNHSLEDLDQQARALFDLLIGPVESSLDKQKQLNIVPDKILNALPFNSLVSPRSGKFLIEDYSISYAPSATVLVLVSTEAATIHPQRAERILTVGNSSFDKERYPSLPNLKEAEREANQILESYKRGNTLIGPAATKQRVLSEMMKSDVVHLALHAIEEPQNEMQSRLVLAKDRQTSGLAENTSDLEAREIYELSLPKTRLAVLSACQTGSGRYYAGEGTFSLGRAFLVSGVAVVVTSLWPVDSEATAELMITFHKIRKRDHLSTAEALRHAQLQMQDKYNRRFRHPLYWSAFSVLGGCEQSRVGSVARNMK